MFTTSDPRSPLYALVSDGAVFPLNYTEALRVSDVPFRPWYDLTADEQARIRAAVDDHEAIDQACAEYRARLAAGADIRGGSEIIGARVLAAAAKI